MRCLQEIFKGFYLMKQFFIGFHFYIAAFKKSGCWFGVPVINGGSLTGAALSDLYSGLPRHKLYAGPDPGNWAIYYVMPENQSGVP
jgi:hypothetical protein